MKRAVLVVCDGLRADMLTPDLTPSLARLASTSQVFANHRSVFPSTTRVTSASIATGCLPRRHGLARKISRALTVSHAWMLAIPTFGQILLTGQLMRGDTVSALDIFLASIVTAGLALLLLLLAARLYEREEMVFGQ